MNGRALLPLLLLAAACSTEVAGQRAGQRDEGPTIRVAQPIVNGTPSTAADNAVVYIAIGSQGEFCTGTLIAPNLVITARHCVSAMNENTECGTFTTTNNPSTMSISVGLTPGAKVATAKTIFVDTPKGNSGCGNDIALFQLDKDVPGALIRPVRLGALTVGEPVTTSGYGDDGSGTPTSSRYQKTGIKVDAVGPASYTYKTKQGKSLAVTVPAGEIVTGESTCFGDSGGPLFDAAGNVIGVTSRGIDEECKDRPSIFSDTASHVKLITDAAIAAGHPLGSAPTTTPDPPGTTPQSDGTTDPSTQEDTGSADEEPAPTTKKKKSTPAAQPAAACSTAPGPRAPSPLVLCGALALGAALTLRRQRR
jgi:secreted trypsin-like serine protease